MAGGDVGSPGSSFATTAVAAAGGSPERGHGTVCTVDPISGTPSSLRPSRDPQWARPVGSAKRTTRTDDAAEELSYPSKLLMYSISQG